MMNAKDQSILAQKKKKVF